MYLKDSSLQRRVRLEQEQRAPPLPVNVRLQVNRNSPPSQKYNFHIDIV